MDYQLKGKRVLVLGSSSGLGFAIAKAYGKEGAHVAITSRSLEHAEEAAKKIPHAEPFAIDLMEESAGRKIVAAFGEVDILVTNAGGPPKGSFLELSSEDWKRGYQGLWMSAIDAIHAALPHMQKQKWGRIIMNTSTSSREPLPKLTISNAYRPGLLGVMKTVSQEVAPYGITVNALMPGFTQTERLKEFNVSEEFINQTIPAQRLGKPEELAALALFLGSASAGYITGQAIACDGGLLHSI